MTTPLYMYQYFTGIHIEKMYISEDINNLLKSILSLNYVQLTRDDTGKQILFQGYPLFPYYVFRWLCILSNISMMIKTVRSLQENYYYFSHNNIRVIRTKYYYILSQVNTRHSFQQHCLHRYMSWSVYYSQLKNTLTTYSFHLQPGLLGSKKLTYPLHIFIELSVSIQENEPPCI